MKFRLIEEFYKGKQYLFRGVAPRGQSDQSNYNQKYKTDLKSRWYAWEIFDDIYKFGDVQVFELLDDSNILNINEYTDVEDFIDENNLREYNSEWLKKIYGINNLNEMKDFDFHDEYHSMQLVATEYLERETNYDGACWYESFDSPEAQIQIWNNNIVRRLPYKEAVKLLTELGNKYPDIYGNSDDIWERRYNIYKGR